MAGVLHDAIRARPGIKNGQPGGQVHWEYVIFERQQIYPEFVVRSVDTAPGMHPIYQVEFELFWLLMSVNARPPFHK